MDSFFILFNGGTEIRECKSFAQGHTARNVSSWDSKLGLSPKTVLFPLTREGRQIDFNSYAQWDALVVTECCVKKRVEAGPGLRRETAVNNE